MLSFPLLWFTTASFQPCIVPLCYSRLYNLQESIRLILVLLLRLPDGNLSQNVFISHIVLTSVSVYNCEFSKFQHFLCLVAIRYETFFLFLEWNKSIAHISVSLNIAGSSQKKSLSVQVPVGPFWCSHVPLVRQVGETFLWGNYNSSTLILVQW